MKLFVIILTFVPIYLAASCKTVPKDTDHALTPIEFSIVSEQPEKETPFSLEFCLSRYSSDETNCHHEDIKTLPTSFIWKLDKWQLADLKRGEESVKSFALGGSTERPYLVVSRDKLSQNTIVINSLERLGPFGRDKNTIYLQDNWFEIFLPLEGADRDSFSYIKGFYGKDKNRIYSFQGVIKSVDKENFKVLEPDEGSPSYATDGKKVFFGSDSISLIDLASFELIQMPDLNGRKFPTSFAKDKDSVYCQAQYLPGADPNDIKFGFDTRASVLVLRTNGHYFDASCKPWPLTPTLRFEE